MRYLLLSLLFIFSISCCYSQKYKLALNLAKDSTYHLSMSVRSSSLETMGGSTDTTNRSINSKISLRVVNIADSIYSMEVRYQSLSVKISATTYIIDVDSKRNDPQDILSTAFAEMMNKPFGLKMNKLGEIISIDDPTKIAEEAIARLPQIDSTKQKQIRALFSDSFGAAGVGSSMGALVKGIFPRAPIAKEDKWTISSSMKNFNVVTKSNYKLTETAAGLYIIHGEGIMASDKDTPPVEINGVSFKYEVNGATISDIRINKTNGWIKEVKMKEILMGDTRILKGPKIPAEIVSPVSSMSDYFITGN